LYVVFAITYTGDAARLDICFHQLRLSMEYHKPVNINAPPESEGFFIARIKVKSSYSQREPAMNGIQLQYLTVTRRALSYPLYLQIAENDVSLCISVRGW